MLCSVSGRQYVELYVTAPRLYNGWMRLYVDRVDQVLDGSKVDCVVVWRRRSRVEGNDQVNLNVGLNAVAVRRELELCGWRERRPGEPAGLLQ